MVGCVCIVYSGRDGTRTHYASPIPLGPPALQLTELKGNAAEVLLPDSRAHLQRSCEVHANESELFWQQRGTYSMGRWYLCCA